MSETTLVSTDNFARAETDNYFSGFVKEGAFGKLVHDRKLTDVAHQPVVRMNRDTLYSRGVFDLDAGPVTVTLPEAKGRFMSMLLVDQDHYTPGTYYAPSRTTITREQVGTRYVALLFRTFIDPNDPADLEAVRALQDAIAIEQASAGTFEVPTWDQASLTQVRNTLKESGAYNPSEAFGMREQVDPRAHLLGTAQGWGGNPPKDAVYARGAPTKNDGTTVYRLTVRDVRVDGFWSLSVYNADGFFEPNPQNAYSLNNITAKPDADGSYTIQFGGCGEGMRNCLPIMPGWNYAVRMYRPRKELLDGSWTFPEAVEVREQAHA